MARFVVNKPVKTRKPRVAVDAGLPEGVHLFSLQVATADGRTSRPDVLKIVITKRRPRPLDRLRRGDNRE
jgi:hypothetical protein